MNTPEEFSYFVSCFYQGSRDEYDTDNEWIAGTLQFLDRDQKLIVQGFLDELLSGRYSDEEIGEIWRRPGPEFDFSTGGHRFFLNDIREVIAREAP
jgi:hypothetical protein